MLIIVKLPFAVPDPIGDYERSLCGDFGTYRERVIKPDMLIRLVQGEGRGIRCETDTCVCAILDCRANWDYYQPILAALPARPVTNSITTVHKFYHDVKDAAYFDYPENFKEQDRLEEQNGKHVA
jgi:ATP-dependent DNA helicase DinG